MSLICLGLKPSNYLSLFQCCSASSSEVGKTGVGTGAGAGAFRRLRLMVEIVTSEGNWIFYRPSYSCLLFHSSVFSSGWHVRVLACFSRDEYFGISSLFGLSASGLLQVLFPPLQIPAECPIISCLGSSLVWRERICFVDPDVCWETKEGWQSQVLPENRVFQGTVQILLPHWQWYHLQGSRTCLWLIM